MKTTAFTFLLFSGLTSLAWTTSPCPESCDCGSVVLPDLAGLSGRRAKSMNCIGIPEELSPAVELLCVYNTTLRRLHFGGVLRSHGLLVLETPAVGIAELTGSGKSLPKLRALDLSGNNIHFLKTFAFKDFPELRLLNLSGNGLFSIAPSALLLPQLTTIDLRYNRLKDLTPYLFSETPSLQVIYLAVNMLSQVPNFVLPASLEVLDLSRNHIRSIEENAFDGINVTNVLDLSRNLLRKIPNAALKRLGSVRNLILDYNFLPILYTGSVVGLTVEKLSIQNMFFISIHRDAFINLPELRELRLSSNKNLIYVHPQSFNNVPRLHTIDLSKTSLHILERELLISAPALKSLRLDEVVLDCHCSLDWLRNLTGGPVLCRTNTSSTPMALPTTSQNEEACAPYIIPLFSVSFSETLGNNVSFPCRALGYPDLKVHWLSRTGKRLFNNQCVGRLCVSDNTLTLRYLHAEDAGNYSCVARNAIGAVNRTVDLRVRDVHVRLVPLTVTSTFVTLAWNMSSAVTNKYTLRVEELGVPESGKEASFTVGLKMHSYTVHGLKPHSNYGFTLAIQREEYSLVIGSTNVTTREDAFLVSLGIETSYFSIIMVSVLGGAFLTASTVFCGLRCWRQRLRIRQAAALRKSNSAFSGREMLSPSSDSPGITYINLSDDHVLGTTPDPTYDDNLISFT